MLNPAFDRASDAWHQIHDICFREGKIGWIQLVCAGGEGGKDFWLMGPNVDSFV